MITRSISCSPRLPWIACARNGTASTKIKRLPTGLDVSQSRVHFAVLRATSVMRRVSVFMMSPFCFRWPLTTPTMVPTWPEDETLRFSNDLSPNQNKTVPSNFRTDVQIWNDCHKIGSRHALGCDQLEESVNEPLPASVKTPNNRRRRVAI